MRLSYVIVSFNRRERLIETLLYLHAHTPLNAGPWEALVVDNGSNDGSAEAVEQEFPDVHVIRRKSNEGVWARNYGMSRATGEYLVLLDDDSYPVGDTVNLSMEYLDRQLDIGAVVGRVILPDGGCEACALPAVMLSGAVCLRRAAVDQVGGFRREFFRKAGEYDFSFRLLDAGWEIVRFDDLIYKHEKYSNGRSAFTAHRMDIRNNLILVERYLPREMRRIYRDDWAFRYTAMARQSGQISALRLARLEARSWALREWISGRSVLQPATIEKIFEWSRQRNLVSTWAREHKVRRVVIADFSKNLFATVRAARDCGLHVRAIADDDPAFRRLQYRGLPILPLEESIAGADGVILSNVNPAQVDAKWSAIRTGCDGSILRLWYPRTLASEVRRFEGVVENRPGMAAEHCIT